MDIARKYLRSFGIQIKSDMNTHRTVKKLMDVLEQNVKP
jgi:biotin operon repressor